MLCQTFVPHLKELYFLLWSHQQANNPDIGAPSDGPLSSKTNLEETFSHVLVKVHGLVVDRVVP